MANKFSSDAPSTLVKNVELDLWTRDGHLKSLDLNVVREVITGDTYRIASFPTPLNPSGRPVVVVDIGAHIGSFALHWRRHNPSVNAIIVCVEVCPENIAALSANVSGFATVIQAACSYTDSRYLALFNSVKHDDSITATGGSILSTQLAARNYDNSGHYRADLRRIAAVTLEDIMKMIGVRQIDVLKLDCEGSEFGIIENSPSLQSVDDPSMRHSLANRVHFICGEYHGRSCWDELRKRHLLGWKYTDLTPGNTHLGAFHFENLYFEAT